MVGLGRRPIHPPSCLRAIFVGSCANHRREAAEPQRPVQREQGARREHGRGALLDGARAPAVDLARVRARPEEAQARAAEALHARHPRDRLLDDQARGQHDEVGEAPAAQGGGKAAPAPRPAQLPARLRGRRPGARRRQQARSRAVRGDPRGGDRHIRQGLHRFRPPLRTRAARRVLGDAGQGQHGLPGDAPAHQEARGQHPARRHHRAQKREVQGGPPAADAPRARDRRGRWQGGRDGAHHQQLRIKLALDTNELRSPTPV